MMFIHDRVPVSNLFRVSKHGHRWYQGDKSCYPSVTTVLQVLPKPEIDQWVKDVGAEKAEEIRMESTTIGSTFHENAEKHINHRFLSNEHVNVDQLDDTQKLLFKQFKICAKRINNIRGLELPLISDDLRVAGTADLISDFDGVLSVVDFKTSRKIKTKSMITSYFIQAAAYTHMFNEMYSESIDDIAILIFDRSGFQPMVFKEKASNYYSQLADTIEMYYKSID